MEKIRVVSVFGTRPEAIKMAPLVRQIASDDCFESVVVVTGQHREMLDQVLKSFSITPNFDLKIMKHSQSIGDITTNVLMNLGKVLDEVQPHIVLVHGDTTTTFAGALAAFYSKIKVGHVEAGLRSGNKFEPFPEEMNRKLTGVLTDLHFAPTMDSKQNLLKENVDEQSIFVTGNTVIDAISNTVANDYLFTEPTLNQLDYCKKIIVMTAHRRENWGKPLENICKAVNAITEKYSDVEVVYAVHKNPIVQNVATDILGKNKKVHLIDPIDIDDMHNLISRSFMILTDSGGLQEEAPALNKPVVVLRNVTERPEGIEAGTLALAGVDTDVILKTVSELIDDKAKYTKMASAKNPFGDGYASKRIVEAIKYTFGLTENRPEDYNWKYEV